jgi:2-polyprenyl-3-methyl-5-hydroxy-6-metoxy-1,4-benzoquinol methylase
MIGRKKLPQEYLDWNRTWGAPDGYPEVRAMPLSVRLKSADRQRMGPFAFQRQSRTRVFEYPWAYFTARPESGMRVLDVGGGLAGFQFVLNMEGCQVTNADPLALDDDNQWTSEDTAHLSLLMTEANHELVNSTFGTKVKLVTKKLQHCDFEDGSFDRIFCLSVLEHLHATEARTVAEHMARVLAPGGTLLLTVDLFFDVQPLGSLTRNVWGGNLDIAALIDGLGLEMVVGEPRELLGFDEFDLDHVIKQFPELLTGQYPVVSQALALRKR